MIHKRPSVKELGSKLKEAKDFLSKKEGFFANESNIVGELIELDLTKASEVWALLRLALGEIKPEHYSGSYPPQPSYEEDVKGEDCWQFTWDSKHFGKRMFLRFMLKSGNYFHSSLHESRKEKIK